MSKGYITNPIGYKRVDAEPLEANTLFGTLAAATEYAVNDVTAYPGQLITVTEGKVKAYLIQEDRSLLEIGTYQLVTPIGKSPQVINYVMDHLPRVIVLDSEGNDCECQVKYTGSQSVTVLWNGNVTGNIYLV